MPAISPQTRVDSPRTRISRGVVHLMKEHYGRGPVSARTYLWEDAVMVVLRGGFTAAEATLLDAGMGQAVKDQRALFQDAMRQRFTDLIEAETGREVESFMSADDQNAGTFAEVFLLEPREGDPEPIADG